MRSTTIVMNESTPAAVMPIARLYCPEKVSDNWYEFNSFDGSYSANMQWYALFGINDFRTVINFCRQTTQKLFLANKLSVPEFLRLKNSDFDLLDDPHIQDLIFKDKLAISQLLKFAPKMDFYLSSARYWKVHELISLGGLSFEQIFELPTQIFPDYCSNVAYFFSNGMLTTELFKNVSWVGSIVDTLCNTGAVDLIKHGKLSIDQLIKAKNYIEFELLQNTAVQKLINDEKLTSEFVLGLARIVASKDAFEAANVKQLISIGDLNIEHVIALTQHVAKMLRSTATVHAQHHSDISNAIETVFNSRYSHRYNGVYGLWDRSEVHTETHEPIFIFKLYNDTDEEIGSVQFFKHPLFCRSELGDRHNIIKTTGVFTQFPINATNAKEVCEVLPPTALESLMNTATHSAIHGALRGMANLVRHNEKRRKTSHMNAALTQYAVYLFGYFLLCSFENIQSKNSNSYLTAIVPARIKTALMMLMNIFMMCVCYGLKCIENQAAQNGWNKTGKVFSLASEYFQYGIFALDAKQRGITTVATSVAFGCAAQTLVENGGKMLVDRVYPHP